MVEAHLKIPLLIAKNYKLPASALLIYGELYGLYAKKGRCYITDKALSKRLSLSNSTVQRDLKQLKDYGLIRSKQKPNYRGRNIEVFILKKGKYILIPLALIKNRRLKPASIVLYGLLYAQMKQIIKINKDKRRENEKPVIETTKTKLANQLGKNPQTIRLYLVDLCKHGYLKFESFYGIGLIIELNNKISFDIPQSKKTTKLENSINASINLYKKRAPTYIKNEHPPIKKMSTHLYKKRATNKYTNKHFNKEENLLRLNKVQSQCKTNNNQHFIEGKPLKKPIYLNNIPNENDMPPKVQINEKESDIQELNKLDLASNSVSHNNKKTISTNTTSNVSYQVLYTKNQNKKYAEYNGSNLEYQCIQLQKILRKITGKHFIIVKNQWPLIEKLLRGGYSLNDFQKVILYLNSKNRLGSINDLLIHFTDYQTETNSN